MTTRATGGGAGGRGVLARLDSAYARLENLLNDIGAAVIFATMLFVCAEVFARTALRQSILGFLDLVELSMAAFAFLGAAYCQRLGGHIRMDLAIGLLRGRWQWLAEAAATLVALVVLALLVKGTFDHFMRAWDIGDTTIDAGLVVWPSKLLAPVGLSFLWLRLLLNFVGYVRLVRNPEADPVAVPLAAGAGHGPVRGD